MKSLIKSLLGMIHQCGRPNRLPIGNRVLIYHAFGTQLAHDTYGISIAPERFRCHLDYLRHRCRVIALSPEHYEDELGQPTVSISIDDGYADNIEAAALLVRRGLPFTVNVTTGFIGRPGYLSIKQLRDLAAYPGCQIGAHGMTHSPFATLSAEQQYDEAVSSRRRLEDLLGRSVTIMAYPYGSCTEVSRDVVVRAGYRMVLTSHHGVNTSQMADLLAVRRTEVIASDRVHNLRRKLMGYYDFF